LLNRFKSGSYKAPPVLRADIPKGNGEKTRPIGIPTVVSYCTSFNMDWDFIHLYHNSVSRV
jgi:retron-type reverse transcriptase